MGIDFLKWASVKMTMKFHFLWLWSTLLGVYQLYLLIADWMKGEAEADNSF